MGTKNISRRATAEEVTTAVLGFIAETGDILFDRYKDYGILRSSRIAQGYEATIVGKFKKCFSLFLAEAVSGIGNELLVEIRGIFEQENGCRRAKIYKVVQCDYNVKLEKKAATTLIVNALTQQIFDRVVISTKNGNDWQFRF